MKTYLLKVEDEKASVLAGFLQEMDFIKEFRPISHWQDADFDDEALEQQIKEKAIRQKNPAIIKHLTDEM